MCSFRLKNNPFLYWMIAVWLMVNFQCLSSYATTNQEYGGVQSSDELLLKGDKACANHNFVLASECYETYLRNNPNSQHYDVIGKLIDIYWQMREYKRAESLLYQLSRVKPKALTPELRVHIADMYARLNRYKIAYNWLVGVPNYEDKARGYQNQDSINALKGDTVDWKISILSINTDFREYAPFIVGNYFVYTSNSPSAKLQRAFDWDGRFYSRLWMIPVKELSYKTVSKNLDMDGFVPQVGVSKLKKFSPVEVVSDARPNIDPEESSRGIRYVGIDSVKKKTQVRGLEKLRFNTSTASFDDHGNIYFTANRQSNEKLDTLNRLCLMEGRFANGSVVDYHRIDFTDSEKYSEMHPAINKAGTLLVFSSNRPGGKGGFDLFFSQRKNLADTWSEPRPLSVNINSYGNEVFPYLSADGNLYFSSDGLAGFGGLDIYKVAVIGAATDGASVEHLGFPINSSNDDFGWIQDSTALTGYFTSDRGTGDDNIYKFVHSLQTRFHHIKGTVKDRKGKNPLNGATVFLLNKRTKEVLVRKTNEEGEYLFDVKDLGVYVIKAVEEDCKDVEMKINVFTNKGRDVTFEVPKPIYLEKIPKENWVLDDMLYDFNQWKVTKENQAPLDEVVRILKKFPIVVELGSHTDSRGSVEYNLELSRKRAEAAVDYIIAQGVDPSRITARGYGKSKLKADCGDDGEECEKTVHRLNRRTEIKIVEELAPANSIDPLPYYDGQTMDQSELPEGFFRK
jgi:outer membrane protein OmpA-like peptidoglycan-associated protein